MPRELKVHPKAESQQRFLSTFSERQAEVRPEETPGRDYSFAPTSANGRTCRRVDEPIVVPAGRLAWRGTPSRRG